MHLLAMAAAQAIERGVLVADPDAETVLVPVADGGDGTLETLVETGNRATPLYLAGIAVAVGFRMNLFNIGVEGQYILGALLAASAGAAVNLPAPLHVLLILVVAMTVAATFSGLAGYLKVTRGVHEVISTIMLSLFMFLFFAAPLGSITRIPGFPADDYEAYLTGMIIVMAVVFNGSDVAFALLTDMLSGYFDKLHFRTC